jgi:hypothetical protein
MAAISEDLVGKRWNCDDDFKGRLRSGKMKKILPSSYRTSLRRRRRWWETRSRGGTGTEGDECLGADVLGFIGLGRHSNSPQDERPLVVALELMTTTIDVFAAMLPGGGNWWLMKCAPIVVFLDEIDGSAMIWMRTCKNSRSHRKTSTTSAQGRWNSR